MANAHVFFSSSRPPVFVALPCIYLESNGADTRVDVTLGLRAHCHDAAGLAKRRLQPVKLGVTINGHQPAAKARGDTKYGGVFWVGGRTHHAMSVVV